MLGSLEFYQRNKNPALKEELRKCIHNVPWAPGGHYSSIVKRCWQNGKTSKGQMVPKCLQVDNCAISSIRASTMSSFKPHSNAPESIFLDTEDTEVPCPTARRGWRREAGVTVDFIGRLQLTEVHASGCRCLLTPIFKVGDICGSAGWREFQVEG